MILPSSRSFLRGDSETGLTFVVKGDEPAEQIKSAHKSWNLIYWMGSTRGDVPWLLTNVEGMKAISGP